MSHEREREIWQRVLSGEALREGEEEELIKALDSNEALRADLLDDAELDGFLRAWGLGKGRGETFVQSLGCRIAAAGHETRFVRKLEARFAEERSTRSRRATRQWLRRGGGSSTTLRWQSGLLAAALLIGVILLATMSTSRPGSSDSKEAQALRVREQRDAEKLRQRAADRRKLEEEAERVRAERARLERELAGNEEEARRLAEEKHRTGDKNRQEELQAREEALKKSREDFKARVEAARERERQASEAAAKAAPGVPQEKAPESSQAKPPTEASVAEVERAEAAYLSTGEVKTALKRGDKLSAGQRLEVGTLGMAVVVYPDKTRLEIGAETVIREFKGEKGKRVYVERGIVRGEVGKQPKDEPMLFTTPHGEAKVLGTTLRIVVDPDPKKGTRLEVEEGKVQIKNLAGKTVDVASGHYAVAAVGVELVSRPLPVNEILMTARSGKAAGPDWNLVSDSETSTGAAWEVLRPRGDPAPRNRPHVVFGFSADSGKTYYVWIRGRCTATQDRDQHDALSIEVPGGTLVEPPGRYRGTAGAGRAGFNGFAFRNSYWWVSGSDDTGREDNAPVTVRFSTSGPQVLRLYADEVPMRVDSLWLSTTHKTRPPDDAVRPAGRPR